MRLFKSLEAELNNKNPSEIFVDGIGRARFSGGVVRVDFLSATEVMDEGDPTQEATVTHRVVMSPQGFLRVVQSLNNLVGQLSEAGVITSQSEGADGE